MVLNDFFADTRETAQWAHLAEIKDNQEKGNLRLVSIHYVCMWGCVCNVSYNVTV